MPNRMFLVRRVYDGKMFTRTAPSERIAVRQAIAYINSQGFVRVLPGEDFEVKERGVGDWAGYRVK